jgi:threonine efflux protein
VFRRWPPCSPSIFSWWRARAAILGINEFGFYGLVAPVLSAPWPRRIYQNAKRGLDALFGGFFSALALKLALEQ